MTKYLSVFFSFVILCFAITGCTAYVEPAPPPMPSSTFVSESDSVPPIIPEAAPEPTPPEIYNYNIVRIRGFHDGLAAFATGEIINGFLHAKWGYMDIAGNVIVKPEYDSVSDMNGGAAKVGVRGAYTYLNADGNQFFDFSDIEKSGEVSEGKFWATTIEKKMSGDITTVKYFDTTGKLLFEFKDAEAYPEKSDFNNGYATIGFRNPNGGFFPFYDVIIDASGNVINDDTSRIQKGFNNEPPGPQYTFVKGVLSTDGYKGIYDSVNDSTLYFSDIKDFADARQIVGEISDGLICINLTNKNGTEFAAIIDVHGNVLMPPNSDMSFSFDTGFNDTSHMSSFSEGLCYARDLETKKCGYIDSGGKWVIKPNYDVATDFTEGHAVVYNKNEWFIINPTGDIQLQCESTYIQPFYPGNFFWSDWGR